MQTQPRYHALALFSGGLDSILAVKLIEQQGLSVLCLHYHTPFFGHPRRVAQWQEIYSLQIKKINVSDSFITLLQQGPPHGFGSVLNPCVDCKILMLRHAANLMREFKAECIISGEVLGQRPMSQRRDTLAIIARDSGLSGYLLRPLSAQLLAPCNAELNGSIDRTQLLKLSGRSRKPQLALAKAFALRHIPASAGGCLLAEKENARSYWPILKHIKNPTSNDFSLALQGRQFWLDDQAPHWLTIGRNEKNNLEILRLAQATDLIFKTADFPGPIGLARPINTRWSSEIIASAAAITASYSSKAVQYAQTTNEPVAVQVSCANPKNLKEIIPVIPSRSQTPAWQENSWEQAQKEIKIQKINASRAHEQKHTLPAC